MIPALIPTHTRRLGLPKSIGRFVTQLMWKCKRYVKTKVGVSKEYICSKIGMILFGIGQGNGGGPAMWIAHLVVMFTVLHQLVRGMVFTSPNKEEVETAGVGYVNFDGVVSSHFKVISQIIFGRFLYITNRKFAFNFL